MTNDKSMTVDGTETDAPEESGARAERIRDLLQQCEAEDFDIIFEGGGVLADLAYEHFNSPDHQK